MMHRVSGCVLSHTFAPVYALWPCMSGADVRSGPCLRPIALYVWCRCTEWPLFTPYCPVCLVQMYGVAAERMSSQCPWEGMGYEQQQGLVRLVLERGERLALLHSYEQVLCCDMM